MTPSSAGCLSVSQQNVSPPIDIKIVSRRPQTTVNLLMKIFSLQMRISEKYVEWLNTIDVKRF